MDILSLRLFLRVAELKAVSAAARDLSLSSASASARLAKLEDTVGFRLFNRTTRAVALTTDGAAFLPYAREVVETLETGLSAVRGEAAEAAGLLRMTMPGSFGRMHVIPLLSQFQSRHPLVQLDLRLSDEVLNVVEGAYDLIIRNAPLGESSMVARKLASDRRLLVAAPSYLEKHGTPQTCEDLAGHRGVILGDDTRWRFEDGFTATAQNCTAVNDGEAMRLLIEQGFGIGKKSVWNVYQSLKEGRLAAVLPQHPLLTTSAVWALYPSGRMVAPKVRAMIDFLHQSFNPVPPWER